MIEAVLISLLFALAMIPILAGCYRTRGRALATAVVLFALVASVATAWKGNHSTPPPVMNRPIEVASDDCVSSRSCRACHARTYATWQASYHRTMTQVADPQTVAGDFDDVELRDEAGRLYQLTRDGDEFLVELDDPESATGRSRRPIVMTTGSHHYQAYWFASDKGRELGMLPFVHLIDEKQYGTPRWILRHAAFLRPPTSPDAKHKPLKIGRWNQVCYMCHATRGQPRLHTLPNADVMADAPPKVDPQASARQHADTHAVEFGIACEACHGGGAQHIAENRAPLRRYEFHRHEDADPTIVNPQRLSHQRSSQICGQCHSVITPRHAEQWGPWHEDGFAYRPGDDLAETRLIDPDNFVFRDDNLKKLEGLAQRPDALLKYAFWHDGMVRVSGREYSGLVATPCYQRGTMSCLSCHQMHKSDDDPRSIKEWADDQLKPGMRGNEACYQCHSSYRDQLESHTNHAADSAGSQCYNCHMPHTSYGLLKAIRSHQISNPDVAESLPPIGRPNACNQCHLNKTLAWTAEHLREWYDIEPPELSEDERTVAASLLWLLKGDAAQRALAAWTMGWEPAQKASGTEWMLPFLAQQLMDPYDSNRFILLRTIRRLPRIGRFDLDFTDSSQKRWAARSVLLNRWQQRRRGEQIDGAESLLMDSAGHLDVPGIQRLIQQRDDRPMYLIE